MKLWNIYANDQDYYAVCPEHWTLQTVMTEFLIENKGPITSISKWNAGIVIILGD